MNYSSMDIILIISLFFFVILSFFLLLRRTKEKQTLVKAIKNNNAAYAEHFTNEEDKLKKALGSELSEKLNDKIANVIKVERDSYKKLCTVFIDHHAEAIQLLPYTINQITAAYTNCLEQVATMLKDNTGADTVSLQETKSEDDTLFQYEALIEQLRYEKQSYADKYKDSQGLLTEIYTKHKVKLGLNEVESLRSMNINELTELFKLKSDDEEVAEPKNDSTPLAELSTNEQTLLMDESSNKE